MKPAQLLPTLLALLIGVFIGDRFFGGHEETDDLPSLEMRELPALTTAPRSGAAGVDPAPASATVDLAARLAEETAQREALEEQVEALREQLSELDERIDGMGNVPATLTAEALDQTLKELVEEPTLSAEEQQLRRFIDAGFPPDQAEALKARRDDIALERLFLRDQARREGWLGSNRFREEMQSVNERVDQLRSQLGDDDYDRYLYATGRPNRVVVRDTLTGGPAASAGLRAGDAIISYDGQRVFDTRSLVTSTQDGEFGAPTQVEVERNGQRLTFYVPRGPLGVNMRSATRRPGDG